MKRLYVCPYCQSEHSGISSGYEDGAGDFGDGLTPMFDCDDCGHQFSEGEGFWGYEGQPDDNPTSDIPMIGDVK